MRLEKTSKKRRWLSSCRKENGEGSGHVKLRGTVTEGAHTVCVGNLEQLLSLEVEGLAQSGGEELQ